MESLIFYAFAAILIASALAVITVRNPVHAVLFLVLTFFTSAAIWLLLEAEFLAITLVLVYVGAVMVLFLFVVMMLDINISVLREGFVKNAYIGVPVALIVVFELIAVVGSERFGLEEMAAPARHAADYSNTKELGRVLYTDYVYAFELAAVVLVVAIIAAIALTMRRRPDTKYQDPAQQVSVRRNDRVRIVKMAAEKKNKANQ
ncbi:NADH:ubiquinone oxidoreductase subunit J [Candidatus Tenderia electrophaga]|jgi:NADH-quinone oxidoreductase subunit J|uniref:NADH-quinone oxidoreductase subunit J n=1 Tax=Candidatus Tenderia electrophaga TaxID=1748243 RepID=A0A0S2TCD4_9GAMM|nr:NADH:ubiquinone oxidoreductase subunit J [Candidatus Tenderia electrophaga]